MKHFWTSMILLGISGQVLAQRAVKIDVRMFASNAGHWYGIKDDHNVIGPKKDQPKYKPTQLREIGDNILLFQKNNGGWAKNYDIMAILTPVQKDSINNDKSNLNTTFDNGTSYTHVTGLAQIYEATQDQKYADGAIKGINFILDAQYGNGGWPQYFPLQKGYSRHITFNDDAYVGIMNTLKDIRDDRTRYGFVNGALRDRVSKAYDKGLECILNSQINDFGEVTAWCQQHDEVTLQPDWARAYEMPSICNAESAGIVQLLMDIDQPSARVVNAVKNAVNWFNESKIEGIRVKTVQAAPDTSRYTVSRVDRVVVQDPAAPPIWARFYELQTHRPIFCNRDGKIVYSLAEVARERRSGYGWYTYNPQKVLDRYPAWAKKWNVTE
ncbi:pectate lyase [Mucilaginibacter daejeonensis]|uniref:pectate lyase n=1 Tax=Mucilaginibacter daejeonensis TaxID=398049 RepID=UPI001D17AFA4|nr:pectate lyase [Mucilaginibacter daejeonensis]UEG52237.1 pectate lyase [Mucilaginibacter daejeonensis]